MIIQQIRNATLKITYMGNTFLIDPWLQDQGAGHSIPTIDPKMAGIRIPMNALPAPAEQILAGVDFCLVTHIHPDHFTPDYLPLDMKLYVQNESDADKARSMGFIGVEAVPESGLTINQMHILKTPAIHGGNPVVSERMGQVHGFYISGEEKSLYIAGDTVFYEDVARILTEKLPDVVAVNCCEATLPIGRLIMNLADIESVRKLVPDATIIATHLDSVNHALLTREDIRHYVDANHLEKVMVPDDGELIHIPT